MKRYGAVYPSKDVSKRILLLPKLLLETVILWPEQNGPEKTGFYILLIIFLICLGMGQLTFLLYNLKNISVTASTMSTVSITLQSIVKISSLYFYGPTLHSIINQVWYEFWPANIKGEKLEKSIGRVSFAAFNCCLVMYIAAVLYDLGMLSIPLIHGNHDLPFESIYFFNYRFSPLYELIYIFQWFINLYVNVHAICGFDYLFLCLSVNIASQFRLLQNVVLEIGTISEDLLNFKIQTCNGNQENKQDLLLTSLKHHERLLRICDQINKVFMVSSFIQIFSSVIAICVSSFVIIMGQIEPAQVIKMFMYVVGHVIQLFLYCVAGNELSSQSELVSMYLFQSNWYKKSRDIKKILLLYMIRAQKQTKLTGLKIIDLNYSTFIGMVKLSASFYKFLSTMQEKN